ncbi:hypothetical protein B0H66DRAFT_606918 [Apodospora peruviana]|uniref:non-specific serine/threonine protein kinase n=1 Tax=Apodospora peruviana TaxID=516989 RepID=A0AAE0HW37_9PEZI|nr:hypothetical protein B0H66DRAFT_606918 [Apodospora peruviana]
MTDPSDNSQVSSSIKHEVKYFYALDPRDKQDWQVNAEDTNRYHKGRFHPAHLGDHLGPSGRFHVVHKLGQGGYATLAVSYMLTTKFSRRELERNHIVLPLEHFLIDGHNGRHICLVLPLLGPTLDGLFEGYGHSTVPLKDICFQLNIMLRLAPGMDEWPEARLLEVLCGPPKTERIVRISEDYGDVLLADDNLGDSVPRYVVEAVIITYGSGIVSTTVAVADFGVSYTPSSTTHRTGRSPEPYASPEDAFSWYYQTSSQPLTPTGFAADKALGPLPQLYRPAWKEMGATFANDEDDYSLPAAIGQTNYEWNKQFWMGQAGVTDYFRYYLIRAKVPNQMLELVDEIARYDFRASGLMPACRRITRSLDVNTEIFKVKLDREEVEQLFDLCMSVFRWDPDARARMGDLLEHKWFEGRNTSWLLRLARYTASSLSPSLKMVGLFGVFLLLNGLVGFVLGILGECWSSANQVS